MKLKFGTKEELQRQREEVFLALDEHERFLQFLMMIQESALLYGDQRKPKNSFEIRRKDDYQHQNTYKSS